MHLFGNLVTFLTFSTLLSFPSIVSASHRSLLLHQNELRKRIYKIEIRSKALLTPSIIEKEQLKHLVVKKDWFDTHLNKVLHKTQVNRNNAAGNSLKRRKRQETILEKARELEKRSSSSKREKREFELRKRASHGNVELKGWVFGGEDSVYATQVMIGTPPQPFILDIDTGSSDSWVGSQKCSTCRNKLNGKSTTLEVSQHKWSIEYGTGSSEGTIVRDTMTIGSFNQEKQQFGAADTVASQLSKLPFDGVLGLAFSTMASNGMTTLMENLIQNDALEQPVFGIYLTRGTDAKVGSGEYQGGEMTIGGVDSAKYTGELNWVPVTTKGYWEIPCKGFVVDGKVINGTEVSVAIDSGSTLLYVPTSVASALFSSIPGSKKNKDVGWTLPCDLPFKSIGLSLGGQTYDMSIDDINLGYADDSDKSQCKLGIMAVDTTNINGDTVAIIGAMFLKSVYSAYSYSQNGKPAVGLAPSVTSGTSGGATVPASPPANSPAAQPATPPSTTPNRSGSGGSTDPTPGGSNQPSTPPSNGGNSNDGGSGNGNGNNSSGDGKEDGNDGNSQTNGNSPDDSKPPVLGPPVVVYSGNKTTGDSATDFTYSPVIPESLPVDPNGNPSTSGASSSSSGGSTNGTLTATSSRQVLSIGLCSTLILGASALLLF